MYKIPKRSYNEITQAFNDGYVDICTVTDSALPGHQPQRALTRKEHLYFAEQRLGINRLYLSRQAQAEIVRVLRVPRRNTISPQDVAITNDGRTYRIDSIQSVPDVFPASMDISLTALDQVFDGMVVVTQ